MLSFVGMNFYAVYTWTGAGKTLDFLYTFQNIQNLYESCYCNTEKSFQRKIDTI